MLITVKLFANFRVGRFVVEVRDYPAGTAIKAVSGSLGLASQEIGMTMLNGRHAEPERVLKDGDVLAFFPLLGGG
ncbi:MoaD/ThiS family protein [Holophaga foetida]|uniref:MoaD/ThiS family protein n=1 Tax=Holophaga foetida TaxID=35839 RepID=UPI0002474D77|nr:MoaD/ThiS family protein [Holophaga foetida]